MSDEVCALEIGDTVYVDPDGNFYAGGSIEIPARNCGHVAVWTGGFARLLYLLWCCASAAERITTLTERPF